MTESSGSTRMPSCSSLRPSSFSLRTMPAESTPRMARSFSLASFPVWPSMSIAPFSGEGDLLAGGDVGRATDDRLRPLAGVDRSEAEAVGVGVGLDAEHVGHADELGLPLLADDLPALDLGDGISHAACELLGREVDIDVVAQPGERKLHETTLSPSHQQPIANSQQPF